MTGRTRSVCRSVLCLALLSVDLQLVACGRPCPPGDEMIAGYCRPPVPDAGGSVGTSSDSASMADGGADRANGGTQAGGSKAGSATADSAGGMSVKANAGSSAAGASSGAGASSAAGTGASGGSGTPGIHGSDAGNPGAGGRAADMSTNSAASGTGTSAGSGGMGAACEPHSEECNNADDDCDGKIDESIEPKPCGNSVSPCKQGTQSCEHGSWSSECAGEVKPSVEVCDGVDNDCDGKIDTGCDCVNGTIEDCGVGVAPCKKGKRTCANGVWPETCQGSVDPSQEICDGVDNDCNGTKDDQGDSLCGSGQHCSGSAGCVMCRDDHDCTGQSLPVCTVSYCNLSSHKCDKKTADRGATCQGSKKCDGTRCVECIGDDCSAGKMCSEGSCIKMPHCGDGVLDEGEACDDGSRNGGSDSCLTDCTRNVCGNELWDRSSGSKEECEIGVKSTLPGDRNWDEFSCDRNCKRRYVYTICNGDSDCGRGVCANGRCYTACGTLAADCTLESGGRGICQLGKSASQGLCAVACSTPGSDSGCPPGSVCTSSSSGNICI